MLLDPTLTAGYIVLATILVISPGPDVMFVIANGMRHRTRGAIASALGIGAGSLCHAAAAALGVSALVIAWPLAFDVIRFAGALYLAWLGVQALRAWLQNPDTEQAGRQVRDETAWRIFRRGLVTNVLNPKVVVFYLALLPQFVSVALGNVGLQIFLLGCIHNLIGVVFLIAVGLVSGKASSWIARKGLARALDGVAGLFFIGLAARLALTGRGE